MEDEKPAPKPAPKILSLADALKGGLDPKTLATRTKPNDRDISGEGYGGIDGGTRDG
jgi:hypothetical protein